MKNIGNFIIFSFLIVAMMACARETQNRHVCAMGHSMDASIEDYVNYLVEEKHYLLDSAISLMTDRYCATLHGPNVLLGDVKVTQKISVSSTPKTNKVFLVVHIVSMLEDGCRGDLARVIYAQTDSLIAQFRYRPQLSTYIDYDNKECYNKYYYLKDYERYEAYWIYNYGLVWLVENVKNVSYSVIYSDESGRKLYSLDNGEQYQKIEPYEIATSLF